LESPSKNAFGLHEKLYGQNPFMERFEILSLLQEMKETLAEKIEEVKLEIMDYQWVCLFKMSNTTESQNEFKKQVLIQIKENPNMETIFNILTEKSNVTNLIMYQQYKEKERIKMEAQQEAEFNQKVAQSWMKKDVKEGS
jgi:hypothetical protein